MRDILCGQSDMRWNHEESKQMVSHENMVCFSSEKILPSSLVLFLLHKLFYCFDSFPSFCSSKMQWKRLKGFILSLNIIMRQLFPKTNLSSATEFWTLSGLWKHFWFPGKLPVSLLVWKFPVCFYLFPLQPTLVSLVIMYPSLMGRSNSGHLCSFELPVVCNHTDFHFAFSNSLIIHFFKGTMWEKMTKNLKSFLPPI